MDKKRVKEIIKNCNKGIDQAEVEIKKLLPKEIIELKAKLKGKNVHFDKWILIVIPFISIAISMLSIIINVDGTNKSWIGILAGILLTVAIVSLFIHIINQHAKEETLVTLCYLEEYTNIGKEIESYEQIENRQKDETKQLLKIWKKKEQYAKEQVDLLEKSLKEKYKIKNK